MGVGSGAKRHANCSNQGFRWFATLISWDRQANKLS